MIREELELEKMVIGSEHLETLVTTCSLGSALGEQKG
jgi:hypothetical protein